MKRKIKQKPDYRMINKLRQLLFYVIYCIEFVFSIPCMFFSDFDEIIVGICVSHAVLTLFAIKAFVKKDSFADRYTREAELLIYEILCFSFVYTVVGVVLLKINTLLAVIQFIICGAMIVIYCALRYRNEIRRWYLKKKEEKRLANKNK